MIFGVFVCVTVTTVTNRAAAAETDVAKNQFCKTPWEEISGRKVATLELRTETANRGKVFYAPLFFPEFKPFDLSAPTNWAERGPNRSWALYLHSFRWNDFWFIVYENTGEFELIERATDVMERYLREAWYSPNSTKISEFVKSETSTSRRVAAISYLLCIDGQKNYLSKPRREYLLKALRDQVDWLLTEEHFNYSNHGIMVTLDIMRVRAFLPNYPKTQDWAKRAQKRLLDLLVKYQISKEGVHLEHTPAYAWLWHTLAGSSIKHMDATGKKQIKDAQEGVAKSLWWYAQPSGNLASFGDQGEFKNPKFVIPSPFGSKYYPESGYAIFKGESSYLNFQAAYHSSQPNESGWKSSGHKHRDELSFVWQEDKKPILVDSGIYDYSYDENRYYAINKQAHNTVSFSKLGDYIEDNIYNYMIKTSPYGSGMVSYKEKKISSKGEEFKYYVATADDPLIRRQGAIHQRKLVYIPGHQLIVVDLTKLKTGTSTDTRFHFHEAWHVIRHERAKTGGYTAEAKTEENQQVKIHRFVSEGARSQIIDIQKGQTKPMSGWRYISTKRRVPINVLSIKEWLPKGRNVRITTFGYGKNTRPPSIGDGPIKLSGDQGRFSLKIQLGTQDVSLPISFDFNAPLAHTISSKGN